MVIAGILTGSIDDEMIDAIMNETYKLNEYYSNAALAGGGGGKLRILLRRKRRSVRAFRRQ